MAFKNIFSDSGGIYYHLSALRYKNKYWQSFIDELAIELHQWPQKNDELTIFAASGGYCLHPSFLKRYKTVQVYDPDPIAKIIFEKRFSVKVKWSCEDLLFQVPSIQTSNLKSQESSKNQDHKPSVHGLESLIDQCQNSDLLFSNFLGQLPLIMDYNDQTQNELKKVVTKIFGTVNTFSFHDLYSFTNTNPNLQIDHLTKNIFDFTKQRRQLEWKITPKRTHIIECAY